MIQTLMNYLANLTNNITKATPSKRGDAKHLTFI